MRGFGTHLLPLNSDTAKAVSGGANFEHAERDTGTIKTWRTFPTLEELPRKIKPQEINKSDDLTGQRKGKMVIVCYVGSGSKTSLWLAKCECGIYEIRRGNTWRKNKTDDRCTFCDKLKLNSLKQNKELW